MRKWLVAAMVFGLVSALAAAVCAAPQAVSLELKGETGQESRYRANVTASLDFKVQDPSTGAEIVAVNPRLAAKAVTVERVTDVADNGDLTLSSQIESFSVTLDIADLHAALSLEGPGGGPPQLIELPPLPIEIVLSKRGQLVGLEGIERLPIPPIPGPNGEPINIGEVIDRLVTTFSQPQYPDHPVKVGESWEWEMTVGSVQIAEMLGVPLPPEAEEQMRQMEFPLKTTSRLVGFETVGGVECAKIEAVAPWEFTVPIGGSEGVSVSIAESGTSTVHTWLDHERGRKVRESVKVEMTMEISTPEGTAGKMRFELSGDSVRQ